MTKTFGYIGLIITILFIATVIGKAHFTSSGIVIERPLTALFFLITVILGALEL